MSSTVPTTRFSRARTASAVLVLVAATSACAATSSTGGTASGGTGSASAAAPVDDQTAVSFVGGKAGAADQSATPVKIGFINQDTGVPSFPEAGVAATAVTTYVNEKLGGVDGHPLELVTCSVDSEAKGQACAQKMLNDKSISAIQTGAMVVGNASLYKTIAGKLPILGGNPTAPADFTPANTYFFTPGSPGVNGAIAAYIAGTLKAKSASVVYSDDPGGSIAGGIGSAAMKAANLKTTDISFAASGGDLTGPLTAAGAQSAEAIDFLAAGPACLQMAQAQKQLALKAKILSVSLCLDPSVKEQLGDYPTWTFGSSTPNVYVDGSDPQVNLYRSVMLAASKNSNLGGFAGVTFGSILDLVKVMNGIGYDGLTPKSIGSALAGYTGSAFLGAPDIKCGANETYPTICTSSARIFTYDGDNKWTDATNGRWLGGN